MVDAQCSDRAVDGRRRAALEVVEMVLTDPRVTLAYAVRTALIGLSGRLHQTIAILRVPNSISFDVGRPSTIQSLRRA